MPFLGSYAVVTNPRPTDKVPLIISNAVKSVLYSRLQPMFDITSYGAVGDNVADDTSAIAAAALGASLTGGGTVYFPAASVGYRTHSQITWPSNVHMLGELDASPVLPDGSFYAFLITGSNIVIDRMKMDGSNVTGTLSLTGTIRISNASNVHIRNSKFVNNRAAGVWIVSNNAVSSNVRLTNCYLTGHGRNDVIGGGTANSATGYIDDVVVEGCYVEQNVGGAGTYYNAIDIVGVRHIQFNGNTIKGCIAVGSEQYPNQFSTICNNTIQPCTGGSAASGVLVTTDPAGLGPANNIVVNNNTFDGTFLSVTGAGTSLASNIVVTGNAIKALVGLHSVKITKVANSLVTANAISNGTSGVYVDGCDNVEISDNLISNCTNATNTGAASTNISYLDNQLVSCTNGHLNVDLATCIIRQTIGNKVSYGSGNTSAAGHHFTYSQSDVPAVLVNNTGTHHATEIRASSALASNRNALHVWSDATQTTTNGLIRLRMGSASSTAPVINVENLGSGYDLLGTKIKLSPNGNHEMQNTSAAPSSNLTGGGYLYAEAGALKWRGSSGTVTTIAVA